MLYEVITRESVTREGHAFGISLELGGHALYDGLSGGGRPRYLGWIGVVIDGRDRPDRHSLSYNFV